MFKKRMGSLLLSAVLAAGLLHTAAGPAAAQETGAGPVLPAELQTVMEEEGFTGLSSDLAADLSSIVFEKADGSRTLYMYDQPVKYRDAGGEVRFKTKKAKKTEKKNGEGRAVYAFENPDNDWKAYLPARIADGVMLEAGGYRLEIFPEAEKNSKVKQTGGEEAPVRYTDALSTQTDLTLAYTLDGLQLQMDLERYTGRNEFRFTIDPHGLTPQALASHMILFQDPQSGETVCTLNPIELRSARYEQTGSYTDVSYYNSYRLTPAENGTYTITAVLDEDFLTDPATVYPLSAETNTAWRRDTKDTTVFKDDSGNYHTSAYDYVGYYLTGRSRLRAMKLAQMDTSVLKFINPSKITNAYYNTTVGGAADSWTLQVGRPTVCWDADTVTYADVENRYDIFYSATLSNTDLTILKIPMTSLLQTWLYVELGESTSLDSRQGIILMPGSNCPQTSCRTFYSADYSVEAGRPAFVVEYTADTSLTNGYYFIRNGGCERYLDLVNGGSAVGTGTCIYNFHGRDNQLWYISLYNSSTGQYTIRPCNIGNRYLSAKNEYASPLTLSDTPCYWRLLRNGNGSYRILVDGSERQAAESASGSTENSAPVKTWGYGGAPNQKWVFEKATQLGGAGAYRQEDSERIKCLAYALESKPLPSIMVPDKDTVENFYERRIEPMVKSMGRQCRKLTSSSSYIRPNEYKIAMRIGINIPDEGGKNDMHFMVQTNTGGWAHKMGRNPSQYLGNINPTTYSWDYYRYNSDGEYTAYIVNGYDSPTLYFAVTR